MFPWAVVVLLTMLMASTAQDDTAGQRQPPSDYERVPGVGHYKLIRLMRKWSDAWRMCYEMGAHLAVINSESEAEALQTILIRNNMINQHAFMGYHDIIGAGEFTTVLGEPATSLHYKKWSEDEGSGNCVVLDSDGVLAGEDCNTKLPFFCEYQKGNGPLQDLQQGVKGVLNWGRKQFVRVAQGASSMIHNLQNGEW